MNSNAKVKFLYKIPPGCLNNYYQSPGCEYIIAITHMRTDNDVRLAEKVPEIGLILGGHSLVYEKRKVNNEYNLHYTSIYCSLLLKAKN